MKQPSGNKDDYVISSEISSVNEQNEDTCKFAMKAVETLEAFVFFFGKSCILIALKFDFDLRFLFERQKLNSNSLTKDKANFSSIAKEEKT